MSKIVFGYINKNSKFIPYDYSYISFINRYITCVECSGNTEWNLGDNEIICKKCETPRKIIIPVDMPENNDSHLFFTILGRCIRCKDYLPVKYLDGEKFICIDCTDKISMIKSCSKCHFERKGKIAYLYDGVGCPTCFTKN